MNSHMRKLIPSGSVVVAVVALLVAMSGSAVAASLITGEQIKDGTIQAKDLSKKTRAKLAATAGGVRGPVGPAGPQGDPGANGRDGQDGLNALTETTIRRGQAEVGAHQSGIAFAHCQPGEQSVGGGGQFATIDGSEWIQRSAPAIGTQVATDGSKADGWFARGFNDENAAQTLTAFAVCLQTGSD
jgi:hypothetical protein